jgi:hypothetical protein
MSTEAAEMETTRANRLAAGIRSQITAARLDDDEEDMSYSFGDPSPEMRTRSSAECKNRGDVLRR